MARSTPFESDGIEKAKPLSREQAEMWCKLMQKCRVDCHVSTYDEEMDGFGIVIDELDGVTIWTERDFRMWVRYGLMWLDEHYWNRTTKKWNKRQNRDDR